MDFARVLVVAIVLFGVLLLIFGDAEIERDPIRDPDRYKFRPIDEKVDAFFVGSVMDTDYRHISLTDMPFELSFDERIRLIAKLDEANVKRGILSNEPHYLEFDLTQDEIERTKSMNIEFDVEETNHLNEIYMTFNEEEFYSGYPEEGSSHTINLDLELLQENNMLEVAAASSWWRFWAPTVYVLRDLNVNIEILEEEEERFTFELDREQARNFRMGRLVLRPDRFVPDEPLYIEVNGVEIYNQRTEKPGRRSMWVDFEYVDVHEGENEVRMFTEEGGLYSFDSASMVLFWDAPEMKKPVRYLDVSRTNYRRLPGEITFRVDEVEGYPEYLTLKLTTADDEEREVMIERPLVEGETVSIDITRDDLAVGENRLEFVVGGDGGYYISDFEVRY